MESTQTYGQWYTEPLHKLKALHKGEQESDYTDEYTDAYEWYNENADNE